MNSSSVGRWVKENWILPLAVFLSSALQFSFISRSSIWHDEAYSLWLIKYDYLEILTRTARDVHPPFYYLVLKFWTSIFGTTELAARSLSVVCVAGIIIFSYLLVKKLFGLGAARTAALFLAFAPFLLRYGQEARMYSMVALFLTAATFVLVCSLNSQSRKLLVLYSLCMALAFYTHYYAIFMVPVHWFYVGMRTHWHQHKRLKRQIDLISPWWWLANLAIVGLFSLWIPSAYAQFTRVQGGFWIPQVNSATLPSTVGHFLHYADFNNYPLVLRLSVLAMLILVVSIAVVMNSKQRANIILVASWAAAAPIAVFIISFIARPVYVDRYFVFSSVGFYVLLAILLYTKPLNYIYRMRPVIIAAVLVLFSYGIRNVYLQSNHKMSLVGDFTNTQYRNGDLLISGELYTYLDFSYYNNTNQPVYLFAPNGVSGYGETSLFYDQKHLVIRSYNDIPNKRIWIVGKVGDKDYYQQVPSTWKLDKTYRAKDSEVRLYLQS